MRCFTALDVFRASAEELSLAEVNSFATGVECTEPSLTQQSQAAEADINEIVRRFGLTGKLPENVRVPTYGDFDGVVDDYQSALNAIRSAEESFMAMPADVRARFNNDPGLFVEFCSDPENLPEMRKLGLAVPEEKADNPPPSDPPPVDPPK